MRFLSLKEIIYLHERMIRQFGGSAGIRDINGLLSAVSQPYSSFEGKDLYPAVVEKACALGYSIIMNHPFVDGNKRTGQASMEMMLLLNGYEINAGTDEQERIIMDVASGKIRLAGFTDLVRKHCVER